MALSKKAVVLLSGGLDSILATKIIQAQGIELEAFNVRTQFECCKLEAAQMAQVLGVSITVADAAPDYLDLIEHPRNGWGKGINPCVDCRAYMFRMAGRFMKQVSASFLVTGEVMGQRPNSQLRHQLRKVEEESDLPGLILRPLSAKLLPPTAPELEGIVDREKLYGISGRSRKDLIRMAREFGIEEIPQPSIGCRLTDADFGQRAREAWAHGEAHSDRWQYELLKIGRHLRLPTGEKIVLGRNEKENGELSYLREQISGSTFFEPVNFAGPAALSLSGNNEQVQNFVGGALLRYAKKYPAGEAKVRFEGVTGSGLFQAAEPLGESALQNARV